MGKAHIKIQPCASSWTIEARPRERKGRVAERGGVVVVCKGCSTVEVVCRGATVDKLALMLMVDGFLEMEVPLAQGGLMIESWVNGIKIVGARKPSVKLTYAIKERAEHAC